MGTRSLNHWATREAPKLFASWFIHILPTLSAFDLQISKKVLRGKKLLSYPLFSFILCQCKWLGIQGGSMKREWIEFEGAPWSFVVLRTSWPSFCVRVRSGLWLSGKRGLFRLSAALPLPLYLLHVSSHSAPMHHGSSGILCLWSWNTSLKKERLRISRWQQQHIKPSLGPVWTSGSVQLPNFPAHKASPDSDFQIMIYFLSESFFH